MTGHVHRRQMLIGLSGAAALAPFLTLEQAMAMQATPASPTATPEPSAAEMMARQHQQLQAVFGENLYRNEEIAMLIYPGFTALDLVGPHYFFACMFGARVHLVTTGQDLSPVVSDLGLAITPTKTMADAPSVLDVLFIPGGTEGTLNAMRNDNVVSWVADRASRARFVTSVCTGSMVLAKAGLLRGRRATSHWVTRPVLSAFGATPVDQRVVTDGNIVTGAGVSAGLDYAIALVEMMRGRAYAEALVLQAEYAPEPPVRAGHLDLASPPVAGVMQAMFAPVEDQFRALAS